MKKMLIPLFFLIAMSFQAGADDAATAVGANGVAIDLVGDFYSPNISQVLQESPAIIEFDGLTERGGEQVVEGYRKAFKKDIMAGHIANALADINEHLEEGATARILATRDQVQERFPELLDFYRGIAKATKRNEDEIYLAAWAEDGIFAKEVSELASDTLKNLREEFVSIRGCTALGWSNGVLGQNQDMPIQMGGYGAIWKSDSVIVHAATPLFTSMAMGRNMATVLNTVDLFHMGDLEDGAPVSGVSMAIVVNYDNVIAAVETLDSISVNAAYSTHFADKNNQIVTIENQRGRNIIIDGTSKGYITHTNHPLGREEILTDMYTFGNRQRFDAAVVNSVWRNEAAEDTARFSPTHDVAALKSAFTQVPILMTPRKGNTFVTTNSVIHDLNAGCSYGTVWLPNVVDYAKVCFDK